MTDSPDGTERPPIGSEGAGGEIPSASRRGFLGLTALIAAATGAMVAGPILPFIAAPAFRKEAEDDRWIPIGEAEAFGEDRRDALFTYEDRDGWHTAARTRRVSVDREEGGWLVLSTVCTHLGCGVNWAPGDRVYHCPCHGGMFDAEGVPIAGPPKLPLARFPARVNERTGQLEIRLEVKEA